LFRLQKVFLFYLKGEKMWEKHVDKLRSERNKLYAPPKVYGPSNKKQNKKKKQPASQNDFAPPYETNTEAENPQTEKAGFEEPPLPPPSAQFSQAPYAFPYPPPPPFFMPPNPFFMGPPPPFPPQMNIPFFNMPFPPPMPNPPESNSTTFPSNSEKTQ
jgi:hypothetical protein